MSWFRSRKNDEIEELKKQIIDLREHFKYQVNNIERNIQIRDSINLKKDHKLVYRGTIGYNPDAVKEQGYNLSTVIESKDYSPSIEVWIRESKPKSSPKPKKSPKRKR